MPACVVCRETITQPLCPGCLERQVATWLQERDYGEALQQLRDVTEEIHVPEGATWCIKCNTHMNVCSYCYLEHVKAWLLRRSPELEYEFSQLFGFFAPVAPVAAPVLEVVHHGT